MSATIALSAAQVRISRMPGGETLLIVPALILVIGFLVIPYASVLLMSFRLQTAENAFGDGYTLGNYSRLLFDSYFWEVLGRTFGYGLLTSFICLLLAYPVAYQLARSSSRYKGLLYGLVLAPLLTGVVIRCYGWIVLLANNGLVNNILKQSGLPSLPLMYNDFGVILGLVHVFLPFMILSLTSAIGSINSSLEEAARSLNASRLQVFARVIMPLSIRGIQSGSSLVFILTVSSFVTPQLLGSNATKMVAPLVVQQLTEGFYWPFGAAMALSVAIMSGIAVYLFLRFTSVLVKG